MTVRGSPPDPLSCRHHPPTQYDKGPPRTETNAPSQRRGTVQVVSTSNSRLFTNHFLFRFGQGLMMGRFMHVFGSQAV
jgi:hypothetical protein